MVGVIVACEVLFQALLFGGLALRYLARRERLGAAALVCAPLVDVIVLVAGVLDMRAGATASFAHVLAALYIGASAGFGHQMIRALDVWFAHRHAGGPPPAPRPTDHSGRAALRRRSWYRHVLAWLVGTGLMLAGIAAVGDPSRTEAFSTAAAVWTVALGLHGLVTAVDTAAARHSAATRRAVSARPAPARGSDVSWRCADRKHGVLDREDLGSGQGGRGSGPARAPRP